MSTPLYYAAEWEAVNDSTRISQLSKHTFYPAETQFAPEYRSAGKEEDEEDIADQIFVGILVAIIFSCILFFTIYNRIYWDKGRFPPFIRFSRQKYFEATVYIALRFMLCNRHNYADNLLRLSEYLRIKFPDIHDTPSVTIRSALDTPVSVDSTSRWLNKHLSEKEKLELFAFLGQITVSDNILGRREREYFVIILQNWRLDQSVLADFEEEIYQKRREQASRESQRTVRSTGHLKEKYAQVLGLEAHASADDIKKAYRKLAMIHHPDKYRGNNDFERESAKIKFIEIQEAYEYLSENVKS